MDRKRAFYPFCGVTPSPVKPLLILIGEEDDWTPASKCYDWVKQYQNRPHPPETVVYPGAHHSFDLPIGIQGFMGHTVGGNREAFRDAQKRLSEFFQRHLQ